MIPLATMGAGALPLQGNRAFGAQRETHVHNGVDLPAPRGTAVHAAEGGTVEHASSVWQPGFTGYGRHVVIEHENGTRALYAHLDSVHVAPGDVVAEGDELGAVGNSLFSEAGGHVDESGGPHLHLELSPRRYPQASSEPRIDPVPWMLEGRVLAPRSSSAAAGAAGVVLAGVAAAVIWLLWRRAA